MTDTTSVPVAVSGDGKLRYMDDLQYGEHVRVAAALQKKPSPNIKPGLVAVTRPGETLEAFCCGSCAWPTSILVILGFYLITFGDPDSNEVVSGVEILICSVPLFLFFFCLLIWTPVPEEHKKDVVWVSGEHEATQLFNRIKRHTPDVILSFTCKCKLKLGVVEEVLECRTCFDHSPTIQIMDVGASVMKFNFKPNVVVLDTHTNYWVEMKKFKAEDQGHEQKCLDSFAISWKKTEEIPSFVLVDRNERHYARRLNYSMFRRWYYSGCGCCKMNVLDNLIGDDEIDVPITKVVSLLYLDELYKLFPELYESYQVIV